MHRHLAFRRPSVRLHQPLVVVGFLLATFGTGVAQAQTPPSNGLWQTYGTENGELLRTRYLTESEGIGRKMEVLGIARGALLNR